jgi:hypothetical protein
MDNVVADRLRRLLAMLRERIQAKPSELLSAVVRMQKVQSWFQRQRGASMVRARCRACGDKERLFTIWIDGKYYCMACLYAQVAQGREGPVPMHPPMDIMEAFVAEWRSYRARIEAIEEPWNPPPDLMAALAKSHVGPLMPPSVCIFGHCDVCEADRPFMRREDGDAGCIHCLMRGRTLEIPYEIAASAAA